MIIIRIDIKDRSELEHVRAIQDAIKIVAAPESSRDYPTYDKEKAFSLQLVEYLNDLLNEVPESETALFERFKTIGILFL